MTRTERSSWLASLAGTDNPLHGRDIVYDEPALVSLLEYKDLPRFDDRLSILEWALWLAADDFPVVDGFERLRVARIYRAREVPRR